jgi:pSer/pThr/pTyr-binding forkhead associated (FHA) protein
VSRQHAELVVRETGVYLEDLGSRHGTRVNGVPLYPRRPARVEPGSDIQLGPERLRVDRAYARIRTDFLGSDGDSVNTITLGASGRSGAEHSLRVLVDTVREIDIRATEEVAGKLILDRMLEVTGLERGLIVRLAGNGDAQVIASSGAQLGSVSRTLLAAAEDPDQVAHLSQTDDFSHAQSVVGSGVREALCVRLTVKEGEFEYMYLDSRNSRSSVGVDIAEFIGAAARICGFVFESIARRRDEETIRDIERAREVQARLLPPATGTAAGISWSLEQRPGALLAGDFAGVAERPDGTCFAWVGDVVGKGAPAAMLMATAQAWLHAAAARGDEASSAVKALNGFLSGHSEDGEYATLVLFVLHPDGRVEAFDAGHGHAFLVGAGGAQLLQFDEGGMPVGMMPDSEYNPTNLRLEPGVRLLLFTDGVNEQPNIEGERFGTDRMASVLSSTTSGDDDIRALLASLERFGGKRFEDDVTILSIRREAQD